MHKLFAVLLLMLAPVALLADDAGLVTRASPHSVADTLDRLQTVLQEKGIKVFARIDHAGEAAAAGLALRPTQLLVFGHPKAGTPLMAAVPSVALDLPLKALVWQDEQGQVWITYNDPAYLIRRHGLNADFTKNLAAIGGLVAAAIGEK